MKWEACHKAPYMVNNNKWVSFDNEKSVKMKADLAWDKQLAGVMVWSIETDDFQGKIDTNTGCFNSTRKYGHMAQGHILCGYR